MTRSPHLPSELVGKRKPELATPRLCLDLELFENNAARVASAVKGAGKNWRPHAKCHKSPNLGRRLLDFGAIGLTCAKVSEAEIFPPAGVNDILVAHMPVGSERVRRIAELCRHANVIITCDHYVQAQALSAACSELATSCGVLVEINVGMNRTGVRPGRDTRELAFAVEKLPGLKLSGIMGYEGHAMPIADELEKRTKVEAAMGILAQARDWFRQRGLCCDIVSAGTTSTLQQVLRFDVATEVHAGGAIFGDPHYATLPDVDRYEPALSVLTTVVSRPSFDRAVLDAGKKAITCENHPPTVNGWSDATILFQDAEHTILGLGPESRELRIEDQVELTVGHADLTTMLHEEYLCFRAERVESVWPITGRGKLI